MPPATIDAEQIATLAPHLAAYVIIPTKTANPG